MMQFEPKLIVRRVRIEKAGTPVFDELFRSGVNIIRGQNSSGKSTVLNFIFYGLGGDLYEWSAAAETCDKVYIEVDLNGFIVSLSREVSRDPQRPMYIYGGTLESGLSASFSDWIRHPYSRGSTLSFSQMIFNLLDMPEAASESTGKLTLHQILRLLYADQLTPVENLFKYDGRWDTPTLRDAVGRLLCGGQETSIYENSLEIRVKEKEFEGLEAEEKAIYSAYRHHEGSLTEDRIAEEARRLEKEISEVTTDIREAERRQIIGEAGGITHTEQFEAYEKTAKNLAILASAREDADALALSLADLEAYGDGLSAKIDSLKNSEVVAATVGAITFEICPVCFSSIEQEPHACHLCKTPTNVEENRARIAGLINDITIQKNQTERVIGKKRIKLYDARARQSDAEIAWKKAAIRLAAVQGRPSTEVQATLNRLIRQQGYLDRKLEELEKTRNVVQRIKEISKQKEMLNVSLVKLRSDMKAMQARQKNQLSKAKTRISDVIKDLLVSDLRRQDSFSDPRVIEFDFASNKISVDGQSYFSASSRVVLKTSFFVGFVIAAANDVSFRHPRFCLIDTIEDKGMEQERSQNFQRLIVSKSSQAVSEHQIIFATAMIAPDLDISQYTVGRYYTRDNPALEI